MIHPVGYRVLLLVEEAESVTKGGVILAKELVDKESRAVAEGIVVELGPTAYVDHSGDPWVKEGDKVLFKKYEHVKVDDKHVMVDDEAIYARIED